MTKTLAQIPQEHIPAYGNYMANFLEKVLTSDDIYITCDRRNYAITPHLFIKKADKKTVIFEIKENSEAKKWCIIVNKKVVCANDSRMEHLILMAHKRFCEQRKLDTRYELIDPIPDQRRPEQAHKIYTNTFQALQYLNNVYNVHTK